jgi:hypothetical protein
VDLYDRLRTLADEWETAATRVGERVFEGDPSAAMATISTLESCATALRNLLDPAATEPEETPREPHKRIASLISEAVDDGLHFADKREQLADAILAALTPSDPLDVAWAEAEAALPEGWRIALKGPHPARLHVPGFDVGHPFYAEASQPFAQSFVPTGQRDGFVVVSGSTPADALRALAARLSSKADPEEPHG